MRMTSSEPPADREERTDQDAPSVPPANPAYSTPPPEGIAESEDG